jgi:proline iminopeptidase
VSTVFGEVQVREAGHLDVGAGHRIYWEESGNPDGIPAVYLHGGPGAGLGAGGYRRRLDPGRFRIIGLDQRGCGRSTPHVTAPAYDLASNTTARLIDDLELLREHLGVQRWLLNGVSCGSTLALAYAQRYPQRVLGVVVFAVRTDSRFEIDWITETVSAIYPEAWDRLATHAEHAGVGYRRGDNRLIEAYARLMTNANQAVRDAAAAAWVQWEDHHISVGPGTAQRSPQWDDAEYRNVFATLVTHYWANDFFLDPPILDCMDRLAGLPATLIHGRRDVSGPAVIAWRLHRSWPGSVLIVCEVDGHGGPDMVEAMCAANSRHADRIEQEAPAD